jgi:hypothetical protein
VAEFDIKFFGWAYSEDEETGKVKNDKIWGYVEVEGRLYNFWGRRGDIEKQKSLKFKIHDGRWGPSSLRELARKKTHPSGGKLPYREMSLRRDDETYTDIDAIYANFTKHFQKQLMWAKLSGNIRGLEA